ncbi:MAG TPA: type I asparaginase [Bacteroidales bacterium]|nr:type I asparaginase [Lentimicrobiaceae bacterium]HOI00204.1 type I asparaginase [Bacteroidales bacterium]
MKPELSSLEAKQETALLVIYTGGTIGMMQDPVTGSLSPFNFDHIFQHMPVLSRVRYRIGHHCFDPLIDSSEVKPSFWQELATVIANAYADYDGFVVLHGTDTMAYTASMLSFMLENLNKPVILTGSQLPLGMVRSDGRENFITALEIAAARQDDTPLVPEVAIYFENKLFRGNRTTKFNAEDFNAFVSENYPILAEAGVHIRYNLPHLRKPNFKNLRLHTQVDPNVAILKLFPGITPNVVSALLSAPGLQGIILETFGSGNAPTDAWFIDLLKEAIGRGITIMNVTQCKGGAVEMGRYASSLKLEEIGVVSGRDITTESATAKMMFLLGQGFKGTSLKKWLETSLIGEMSV